MADTGPRLSQARDLVRCRVDHVRVPDIRPDPSEIFGILDRRAAKALHAIGILIARLGQVRVRVDAVGPRLQRLLVDAVVRETLEVDRVQP